MLHGMDFFPRGLANNLLWKTAARAGLRRIGQMIASGDLAGANRLATTPGVLKKTMAGSQIKQLGAGMEGVSTLVAHPKRGIEVRKVIDPQGIAGGQMIANREAAGRALQNSQDVAQFRGGYNTDNGLRVQRYEYAPGQTLQQAGKGRFAPAPASGPSTTPNSPSPGPSVAAGSNSLAPQPGSTAQPQMTPDQRAAAQIKRLKLQGQRAGFQVADLHEANMVMNPNGGGGKAVDFISVPNKGSVGLNQANFALATKAQAAAADGRRTPYLNYLQDPRRAGNVMSQAFSKNPAAPLQSRMSSTPRSLATGAGNSTTQNAQTFAGPSKPPKLPSTSIDNQAPVMPSTEVQQPSIAKETMPQAPNTVVQKKNRTIPPVQSV